MLVLTYFLVLVLAVLLIALMSIFQNKSTTTKTAQGKIAPTPRIKLPIIGHLHLLAGYVVPYQAFTDLGRKFGKVLRLQLGSVPCAVINGQKNIREALVTKGHHFDARPNFQRYQQLFSGNKENSLAFCDWSCTQKARRDMLKAYTFPRAFTNNFFNLDDLIVTGTNSIVEQFDSKSVAIKPIILKACANIFTQHFCSKTFPDTHRAFVETVENFDDIFYEVNQGYAADFLPFLLPLHRRNLKRVNQKAHSIRQFVLDDIIADRFEEFDAESEPDDYVDSLIKSVKRGDIADLTWDMALFALEDIIGGHSAVANFVVKMFGFLVDEPEVIQKIQQEIDDRLGDSPVRISDRSALPYTEATIFEAIRLIASPIVPRVANQDSSIGGYHIEEGTVIFLNNYELSVSEDLWDEPAKFKPERFIRDGSFVKPDHFLPFGGGRRSCMGYKMVLMISFGVLGGVLQKLNLKPAAGQIYKVPINSLALPKDTFQFKFEKR